MCTIAVLMPHKKAGANTPEGSLSEHAYQAVRRMILRGDLLPGASLSRRSLAADLGMSFLPISEALQRLEHEGLVESRPRVGTRVRVPTIQDVRDNYVVREALESQSARLFAEKASSAEREEMMKMAREVDAMRADPNIEFFDFFSFHERFHRRIAECTGCGALTLAIEKTNTLIRTWHYAALSDYRKLPVDYHVRLMDILTHGNPEEADRAMREHVRYGMDDVLQRLEPLFQHEGGAVLARRSAASRAR